MKGGKKKRGRRGGVLGGESRALKEKFCQQGTGADPELWRAGGKERKARTKVPGGLERKRAK